MRVPSLKYKNMNFSNAEYMHQDDGSNRKTRKHRVKNLSKLGFETGKLYRFNGRFRKVYRTKRPEMTFEERQLKDYKIRKGDPIMFLSADLWIVSSTKRKYCKPKNVESFSKRLEDKGKKVLRVEGFRNIGRFRRRWIRDDENPKFCYIFYREPEEKYSGRLYIGHGEKFGWINIVQMTKEDLKAQFEKIDL